MPARVLSSDIARMSIQRFQTILNGPLLEQIMALNTEGEMLSDPNNWDGNLAAQFRGDWPGTHARLTQVRESLESLQASIQRINVNIMQAGGNV